MTLMTETERTVTAATLPTPGPWTDVYVRKALDDPGIVPYPGATWTWSPDIVPNGTAVIPNASQVLTANYGSDPGQATVPHQPNYYYVRSKNLYDGARTATYQLFYCPAHLFLFPSLWSTNELLTSSGNPVTASAANNGDVMVGSEPFVLPAELAIADEHHCLVCRLTTPGDPNPLPADADVGTMDLLGQFILNHPDFAWRNVVTVDKAIPTFTHTFTLDTTPANSGGTFLIGISFKNLTPGSQVAFSAGTPVPSGPDQGSLIQLVQTPVTQSNGSLGTAYLTIPAGYKTEVSYSYWAQPPVLGNWSVEFYAILIVDSSSALYEQARPLYHVGAEMGSNHPLFRLADSDGYSRGVKVGTCATRGV